MMIMRMMTEKWADSMIGDGTFKKKGDDELCVARQNWRESTYR